MTAKIINIGTRNSGPENSPKTQTLKILGNPASLSSDILDLNNRRGFYSNRIPTEGPVRQFFRYLLSTKTIYIVQCGFGDIQGTDIVYVMENPDDDSSEKIEMTVKEFYTYIADDPSKLVHYGAFLTVYITKYDYILGIVDDPDDEQGENMNYVKLSEVAHFYPESIPMIDPDEASGYSYAIIEEMGEVMIPAENFTSTESYTPPLLFLFIDAVELLGEVAEENDVIHIVRYVSGDAPSLTMETTFRELLELIDASILRGYKLLSLKHNTAEKRRRFIHENIVKKHLDPKHINGRMMMDDIDE